MDGRVILWIGGMAALMMAALMAAAIKNAGDCDRLEEEWLRQQKEKAVLQHPPPEVYDALWQEDKKHCGLLEEDEYD